MDFISKAFITGEEQNKLKNKLINNNIKCVECDNKSNAFIKLFNENIIFCCIDCFDYIIDDLYNDVKVGSKFNI